MFFISFGVCRREAEKRFPDVWVCGQVQKISSSFLSPLDTASYVISPYICSFVAAFVLGVVYIVVLEKGAAVVVFLQRRCACDEYRLPTFRPSNAQLTTYGPPISAGGTL